MRTRLGCAIFIVSSSLFAIFLFAGCGKEQTCPLAETPATPAEDSPILSCTTTEQAANEPDFLAELTSEDLLAMVDQVFPSVRFELELRCPVCTEGEQVDLRHLNGFVSKGKITAISDDSLCLSGEQNTKSVRYSDLSFKDRIRVDSIYRNAWIDSEAILQARRPLADDAVALPEFTWANAEELEMAARCGDPKALNVLANKHLNAKEGEKDIGYALLYFRTSAAQDDPEGLLNLGLMYLKGLGVSRNQAMGLRYIARAASLCYQPAVDFMAERKVSQEASAKALAEYKRNVEEERRAYAARLEAARANPKYDIISQSTGLNQTRRVSPVPSQREVWYEWNGYQMVKHTRIGRKQ